MCREREALQETVTHRLEQQGTTAAIAGSPPTALQAAEPLSPAGMGKEEAKYGPHPWKGSREEDFTFHSHIPAADTRRRSWGTLQKPPSLPPPCQVAGQ